MAPNLTEPRQTARRSAHAHRRRAPRGNRQTTDRQYKARLRRSPTGSGLKYQMAGALRPLRAIATRRQNSIARESCRLDAAFAESTRAANRRGIANLQRSRNI